MKTVTLLSGVVALLFAFSALRPAFGQNMPADSSVLEITTCQTTIFDPGGPNEVYPDSAEGFVRLCPEMPGSAIQLRFKSFATEADFDFLQIYNGSDDSAPLIASLEGGSFPQTLTSSADDGCLFLRFFSDGSFAVDGFEIEAVCADRPEKITLLPEGGRLDVCNVLLFDTGGPDSAYKDNENWEYTICPEQPGQYVRLRSEAMNLELGDALYVFNGPNQDLLLKTLTENDLSLDITSVSPDGCLSLRFISDFSVAESGFQLLASCEDDPAEREPTDCINAVSICRAIYTEDFAPLDEGFAPSEINPQTSCLKQGEQRGIWYRFTVLSGGKLGFVITPDDTLDDYDWTLFNISNASCADLFERPELEVSCNYNEATGETGMTEDGERDRNGDGPLEMQFNQLYDVSEGEEFVLYVSSFAATSSGDGYTIDFSKGGGDADIFDPNVPGITGAHNCGDSTIFVEFSEPALCEFLAPQAIVVSDGEKTYSVTAATGPGCVSGVRSSSARLALAEPLPAYAEITVAFAPGALADDCQNSNNEEIQVSFTTAPAVGFRNIAKRNTFGGENNGVVFLNGGGGAPPYRYSLDGLFYDAPRQFRELFDAPYTAYIEDANGCRAEREIIIR